MSGWYVSPFHALSKVKIQKEETEKHEKPKKFWPRFFVHTHTEKKTFFYFISLYREIFCRVEIEGKTIKVFFLSFPTQSEYELKSSFADRNNVEWLPFSSVGLLFCTGGKCQFDFVAAYLTMPAPKI